jgi:phage tail sheath protein FI
MEKVVDEGTKWVVFEPNDEPLWAQIRLSVGAFMHDLFSKGAFQRSLSIEKEEIQGIAPPSHLELEL